jgi:hypothetical protein
VFLLQNPIITIIFFFLFILYYLIAMCDVVLWEREVTFGTLADLPSMAEKLAVAQSIFE